MNCFYCFVISGHLSGTPDYLAPEILLRHPHGEGADWWGLGVVLYELLVGVPPFSDETPELVFSNILALNLEFPEGEESLSAEAEGAVRALLRLEQQERAGLQQIQVKCSREGDFHICSVEYRLQLYHNVRTQSALEHVVNSFEEIPPLRFHPLVRIPALPLLHMQAGKRAPFRSLSPPQYRKTKEVPPFFHRGR